MSAFLKKSSLGNRAGAVAGMLSRAARGPCLATRDRTHPPERAFRCETTSTRACSLPAHPLRRCAADLPSASASRSLQVLDTRSRDPPRHARSPPRSSALLLHCYRKSLSRARASDSNTRLTTFCPQAQRLHCTCPKRPKDLHTVTTQQPERGALTA